RQSRWENFPPSEFVADFPPRLEFRNGRRHQRQGTVQEGPIWSAESEPVLRTDPAPVNAPQALSTYRKSRPKLTGKHPAPPAASVSPSTPSRPCGSACGPCPG